MFEFEGEGGRIGMMIEWHTSDGRDGKEEINDYHLTNFVGSISNHHE
jgi:hypothetical protein